MNLEQAIPFLRKGHRIFRSSNPDFYLHGNEQKVLGSFYLTLFDILATDWEVQMDLFHGQI